MSSPSDEEKDPPSADAFSPELDSFYAKTLKVCSRMKGHIELDKEKKRDLAKMLKSEFGDIFYSDTIVPMIDEHKRTGGVIQPTAADSSEQLPAPMER